MKIKKLVILKDRVDILKYIKEFYYDLPYSTIIKIYSYVTDNSEYTLNIPNLSEDDLKIMISFLKKYEYIDFEEIDEYEELELELNNELLRAKLWFENLSKEEQCYVETLKKEMIICSAS